VSGKFCFKFLFYISKLYAVNKFTLIQVNKKNITIKTEKTDLIFIKSNLLSLTTSLKKWQTQGLLLSDYIEIINDIEKSFETLRGPIGLKIQSKLK